MGLTNISSSVIGDCKECQCYYGVFEDEEINKFKEDVKSGKIQDEGSFSWEACNTCGSTLGGTRYDSHALDENNELVHLDICTDCLAFFANGSEPENWEE